MRKNACGMIGYETVCINGCCETVAFSDCAARSRRQLKKAHRRK